MIFHGVLYCSLPFYSPLIVHPLDLTMAFFISTVCGHAANTIFDCNSPVSTLSPSFGSSFNYRCGKSSTPVSVVTTTGLFSCLVKLIPESVDTAYDVKLGRDWFNYCTTSVPDAQILLSDDTCLVFSSSAASAVRSRHAGLFVWSESCVQQPLIMFSIYASLFRTERSGDIRCLGFCVAMFIFSSTFSSYWWVLLSWSCINTLIISRIYVSTLWIGWSWDVWHLGSSMYKWLWCRRPWCHLE